MSKRKSLDADLPSVPNVYKSPRRARGRGSLSRSLSEPNVGVHTTTLHLGLVHFFLNVPFCTRSKITSFIPDPYSLTDIPSDTQIGMQVLKSQFPVDSVKSFAPIILKNQLYAIVHDHTEVDREVVIAVAPNKKQLFFAILLLELETLLQDLLRREGTIKVFKLLTGKKEYAILYSEDYMSLIEEAKKGATCKDEKNRVVFGTHTVVPPYLNRMFVNDDHPFHLISIEQMISLQECCLSRSQMIISPREGSKSSYLQIMPQLTKAR